MFTVAARMMVCVALISGDFAPRVCFRNVIYCNRMKFLDEREGEREKYTELSLLINIEICAVSGDSYTARVKWFILEMVKKSKQRLEMLN